MTDRLTPAEVERLAMLAEECAEVIQIVGKVLRHGYDSHHPDSPLITNRDLLAREVRDVDAVVREMKRTDFRDYALRDTDGTVWLRKLRYTYHQQEKPHD